MSLLRRFKLRFGIRTLLTAITLVAVAAAVCAAWYHSVVKQRDIVDQLTKQGAYVRYDRPNPASLFLHPKSDLNRWEKWLLNTFGKDAVFDVQSVQLNDPPSEQMLALIVQLRNLPKLQYRVSNTNFSDAHKDTGFNPKAWDNLVRCDQLTTLTLQFNTFGKCHLQGLSNLTNLQKLTIESGTLTAEGAKELSALKNLKSLNLNLVRTNDEALQLMASLKNLEEFELLHAGLSETVTNQGVAFVGQLPKLKRLTLGRMPLIDDEIVKEIAQLKQLEYLNLDQATIRGTHLGLLKDLTKLSELNLVGTKVGDAGVEQLAHMRQLKTLNLQSTNMTDAAMPCMATLVNLEKLNLAFTNMSDPSMKYLQDLKLNELFISHTKISDAGIKYLFNMSSLRSLGIDKTRISSAGRTLIDTEMPQCQIW